MVIEKFFCNYIHSSSFFFFKGKMYAALTAGTCQVTEADPRLTKFCTMAILHYGNIDLYCSTCFQLLDKFCI